MSSTCHHCGRPLRDPVSVATGLGPRCASFAAAAEPIMFEARWTTDLLAGAMIVTDAGGSLHVVEDAQRVLRREHAEMGHGLPEIILTRRADGQWLRLRHRNGVFGGVVPFAGIGLAEVLAHYGVRVVGEARLPEVAR